MTEPGSPREVLRLDTGVHDLAALLAEEFKSRMSEVLETADVAHTAQAKLASDSMRASLSTEAKAHARRVGTWVALAVTGFIAAGGGALWTYAGPQQAVQKAEAATTKVEEKADELEAERAKVETLRIKVENAEQERESERRALVDDRIGNVESRTAAVEGRLAGADVKLDRLLDAALDPPSAKRAKVQAEKTAAAVESAANKP